MVKWNYVQDVQNDKTEAFCEDAMKKHPKRIYKIATARSNNPVLQNKIIPSKTYSYIFTGKIDDGKTTITPPRVA